MTDQSQNKGFQDKYYAGIPIDLSKVIFVFSYNHEDQINPILRDRMYTIKVEGFNKWSRNKFCDKLDLFIP